MFIKRTLLVFLFILASTHCFAVEVGKLGPEFCLKDQTAQKHCLSQYRGQWVVLYFYPKDDTPGCTKEACHFRDQYERIIEKNAVILGVSLDDVDSHNKFSKKYRLNFPILADVTGEVSKTYGTFWSLGPLKYSKRNSFLLNPEGIITHIYKDVDPEIHAKQILTQLKEAQINAEFAKNN
ncbi:MAG: peroxiredoxin [bacterium]